MDQVNRRSRLEIYFEVLSAINAGVTKPTRIMYATNLSFTSLNEVLATLQQSQFIREERRKRAQYFITQKGQDALLYYTKSIQGLRSIRIDV